MRANVLFHSYSTNNLKMKKWIQKWPMKNFENKSEGPLNNPVIFKLSLKEIWNSDFYCP